MTFVDLTTNKEDVARRTTAGQRHLAFPPRILAEKPVLLPSCSGCSKATDHLPCKAIGVSIPNGETRYQRVPVKNRMSIDDVNELQSALFLAAYIAHGYIGNEYLYNVGASGNNASQFVTYEVISATASSLTLKGKNPKRITLGTLTVNPNWPLEAPSNLRPAGMTDEEWDLAKYARLIPGGETQALPVGASVEFEYPLVLFNKVFPLVTRVHPPASDAEDDVTFTVDVDIDCSNARRPWDLYFPPPGDKYFCKVRWEALSPAWWLNVQAPIETQFTRRVLEFDTADVHELRNPDKAVGGTRILYPEMMSGAISVVLHYQAGGTVTLSEGAVTALLETTQSEDNWTTTLDLSGFDFDTEYSKAVVTFHHEATALDEYRIPFCGSCSNAQVDPSGSYKHGDTRFCARAATATQFGTFRDACWQPECSGFALGEEGSGDDGGPEAFGARSHGPDDVGDPDFWSALWHRGDWYISQGIPGVSSHRNFSFVRPSRGGPSIQSLCGSFTDEVPEGYFATHFPFHEPRFGRRLTWEDSGNEYQAIIYGAFYSRPYDYSGTGGPDYTWTAGSTPEDGSITDAVSGWSSKPDALGGSVQSELHPLPYRATGRTNVYSYTHGGSSLASVNELLTSSEVFVTAVSFEGSEDTAVSTAVRARFA